MSGSTNSGWTIISSSPETKKSKRVKVVAASRPVSVIAKSRQQEFEEALERALQPERLEPLLKAALKKHRLKAQRIFGEDWREEHSKLEKAEPKEVGHDLGGEGVGLLVETASGERRIGGGKLTKTADEKRANFDNIVHKQRSWNGVRYDD